MIRTLFIGSNWEALTTLNTLIEDDRFEVVGLITQPDKPVGRNQEIKPTEIKQFAFEKEIEVFHTGNDVRKYKEALDLFKPDLIVCKSFGEMLPEFFIDAPKFKTINVHYSLLPKYRGAVPIQKAILEGDTVTGITFVQMVEKMDAGPILKVFEEEVKPHDSNQSLRERLVSITSENIGDVLEAWTNGSIKPEEQNEDDASYCWQKEISKNQAYIDWENNSPIEIDRMVRAFIPWPVAWTFVDGKRLKIFEAKLAESPKKLKPGEYFFNGTNLFVGTKEENTSIILKQVQPEGKSVMNGDDLARGMISARNNASTS